MGNAFVHVELNTPDPEKAKAFYSKLFQWKLQDIPNPAAPEGVYTMVNVGNGTGGGIMKQVEGGPSGWLAYVEVPDIRAATETAKQLGGKVMKEETEIPGMGWLGIIQDPTGSILGLWKPKSR